MFVDELSVFTITPRDYPNLPTLPTIHTQRAFNTNHPRMRLSCTWKGLVSIAALGTTVIPSLGFHIDTIATFSCSSVLRSSSLQDRHRGGKRIVLLHGKNLEVAAAQSSRNSDEIAMQTSDLELEASVQQIRDSAATVIKEQEMWTPAMLDEEKYSPSSCWSLYRDELKNAVERVDEGLIERHVEARLVVLGMVTREHVLLLGEPGTAKSALGRRLSRLCENGSASFFQRLLTRFTTPEEIFGPLSLRALENDEYKRCTEGFLPTASVAFLDEIFKANSAILNTLLTILNERQFDNGGGVREQCPIRCVVGASNELPESDELDALYDRFLLRKEVLPVSDEGLLWLLSMPTPGISECDEKECEVVFSEGLDKVVEALSTAADKVEMNADVCLLLRDLRIFMKEELDVALSDRRLVKAARLLKICAASHGRTKVDPLDCLLLQHIAWQLPEQRNVIREFLWEHLTPSSRESVSSIRMLLDGLRNEAITAVRKTSGHVTGELGAREADLAVIQSLRAETSRISGILRERAAILARHQELLQRAMDHIWLDHDECRAAQQLLQPKAEYASKQTNQSLEDAVALELVLSGDCISPGVRVGVLEELWEEGAGQEVSFSFDELNIGMKEAKKKYDTETFRKWKRARKKATKE